MVGTECFGCGEIMDEASHGWSIFGGLYGVGPLAGIYLAGSDLILPLDVMLPYAQDHALFETMMFLVQGASLVFCLSLPLEFLQFKDELEHKNPGKMPPSKCIHQQNCSLCLFNR